MNLTIKNTLKTFAGIAVLGSALFMQSFTENSRVAKAEKLAGELWTNSSTSGDYGQLPATEPYEADNCLENSEHACAYMRTEKPGTVPTTFNAAQAAILEADSLIAKVDNKLGIYDN